MRHLVWRVGGRTEVEVGRDKVVESPAAGASASGMMARGADWWDEGRMEHWRSLLGDRQWRSDKVHKV